MGQYDVVVIGGGAAGLSAALVLSRARRTVLVVDAGEPRNAPATHMHGYLSRDGLPPGQLLATGRHEVKSYGGDISTGTVTDLLPDGRCGFWALLAAGRRISARRLLVTTGLRDELPDVPGLRDRWARDVLHCPYCHGHEVRDRQLGVLGGAAGAVRYAQIVRQWTHDLVYFTPPDVLADAERSQLLARAIGVVEGTIEQLVLDDADQLRGVQMHDGCVIPRDALFVPPRFVPYNSLLVGLGCDVDGDGWVVVDDTGGTSLRRLGRRQRRRPARPGHQRRWRRLRGRHRPQRRPGRGGRTRRRPRPRLRRLIPPHHERPLEGVPMTNSTLAIGNWLCTLTPVGRTFVLATIAVPIVSYGLMPQLHRLRRRLLIRVARR